MDSVVLLGVAWYFSRSCLLLHVCSTIPDAIVHVHQAQAYYIFIALALHMASNICRVLAIPLALYICSLYH